MEYENENAIDPGAAEAVRQIEAQAIQRAFDAIVAYDPEAKRILPYISQEDGMVIAGKLTELGELHGYKMTDAADHAVTLWDEATNSGMLNDIIERAQSRAGSGLSKEERELITSHSVADDLLGPKAGGNPTLHREQKLQEVTRYMQGKQRTAEQRPMVQMNDAPLTAEETKALEGKSAAEIAKILDPSYRPYNRRADL